MFLERTLHCYLSLSSCSNPESRPFTAWRASSYLRMSTCLLSMILNICPTLNTVLSPQTNCSALNKPGKYFLQLLRDSPSCSHSCHASTNTPPHRQTEVFFFFPLNSLPGSLSCEHLSLVDQLSLLIFPAHLPRITVGLRLRKQRCHLSTLSPATPATPAGQKLCSGPELRAACPGCLPQAAGTQGRARRTGQLARPRGSPEALPAARVPVLPGRGRRRTPGDHLGRAGDGGRDPRGGASGRLRATARSPLASRPRPGRCGAPRGARPPHSPAGDSHRRSRPPPARPQPRQLGNPKLSASTAAPLRHNHSPWDGRRE